MKDYYRILQITPDATQEEVKRAYRRLAKVHHPDVAGSKLSQEEIFIQDLNEAYRTLNNPDKRSRYDWVRTNKKEQETPETSDFFNTRRHPKPKRLLLQDEAVKPYLKYTHTISRIALVFCLLLSLDFVLPLKERTDKAIYMAKVYTQNKSSSFLKSTFHEYTLLKTWSGRKLSVSTTAGEHFAQNPNLLLYSTLMFGKTRYVAPAAHAAKRFLVSRSIYGNFIFIPMLLLLTSLLGSIRRFPPKLDFSFGLASAMLLLICLGLVLV